MSLPSCDAVSCVCVRAYVICIGPFVHPDVFEVARAPDRVSMDEGAWIPLKIGHLPRWHHTGFYQLYPGEEIAGVF